jgi:hypothetical protein
MRDENFIERQRRMIKKRVSVLSIGLYVLAALLLGYAVWATSNAIIYISGMIDQGQLIVSGNEFDIANFVMSNAAQYFVYAVVLATLGWIVQQIWAAPLVDSGYIVDEDIYEDEFDEDYTGEFDEDYEDEDERDDVEGVS